MCNYTKCALNKVLSRHMCQLGNVLRKGTISELEEIAIDSILGHTEGKVLSKHMCPLENEPSTHSELLL